MFGTNSNLLKLLAASLDQGPRYMETVLEKMAGKTSEASKMSNETFDNYLNTLTEAKEKIKKYNPGSYDFIFAYLHLQAGNACIDCDTRWHHFDAAIMGFKEYIHNSRKRDEILYISYWRLAGLLEIMNTSWATVEELLLQAFQVHPCRAESLRDIIIHYYNKDIPRIAYVFSSFCSNHFYGRRKSYDEKWLVDDLFYQWKVLYYHVPISLSIGKHTEAKQWYDKLLPCVSTNPDWFHTEDIARIKSYLHHFENKKQKAPPSSLQVIIS